MAVLKREVWNRTVRFGVISPDKIDVGTFNLVFALTTAFGMLVYGILAALSFHTKLTGWETFGLFVVTMVGCFVAIAHSVSGIKLVGLAMISGGLGAISGPYVGTFKLASVAEIAGATVVITLILGFFGWVYPKSLSSWASSLGVLLIALIVVQIFVPIIYMGLGLPLTGVLHLLDWLGILLFSAYIIYDFNRAQEIPKTIANAIECGVSVFLDIANLFIRLLSLFGQSNDD